MIIIFWGCVSLTSVLGYFCKLGFEFHLRVLVYLTWELGYLGTFVVGTWVLGYFGTWVLGYLGTLVRGTCDSPQGTWHHRCVEGWPHKGFGHLGQWSCWGHSACNQKIQSKIFPLGKCATTQN